MGLFEAMQMKDIEAIEDAIADGEPVSEVGGFNGIYPLIFAIAMAHEEIVRVLLKHGAKPDVWDKVNECSPLILAVKKHLPGIVNMLLDHGADPGFTEDNAKTPLIMAKEKGFDDMEVLLERAFRQRSQSC